MGTSDDDRSARAQDGVLEPFGQADVAESAFENGFHFGVSSAQGIPDNDEAWAPIEIGGGIPRIDGHAQLLYHVGSRRVEGIVASAHVPSGFDSKAGSGDHGRAADADEMGAGFGLGG